MSEVHRTDGLYGIDDSTDALRRAFLGGEVPVAVYGLGKLGLPVAASFADVCGNVTGADVDPDVVAAIENGDCPVEGEPGLPELVGDVAERDALRAVEDPADAARHASVHVIVVPTLLDEEREPDLATLIAVTSSIAAGLEPGDLVLLESTVPPGTTADVLEPSLADASGLSADEFGVAFCPERTRSGSMLHDIREAYPKIVGGTDEAATRAASLLYDEITENDVLEVSDASTAEAVKVFGGVYRDVNIGLANEFARYADEIGIDVHETIEASNTQPLSSILRPGPGVGGHCIPVYPHFLTKVFEDVDGPVVPSARAVNDEMPEYTVERLADEVAARGGNLRESTVGLFGLTYRPGVAETRYSPAFDVAELLADFGADVVAVDPLVDEPQLPTRQVDVDEVAEEDLDAAIVVTPHEEFGRVDWSAFDDLVLLDGRDALDCEDDVARYCRIGDGDRPSAASRWFRADPHRAGGASDD